MSSKLNEALTNESWGVRNIHVTPEKFNPIKIAFADLLHDSLPDYSKEWTI